jgi:uncharacterized GH25 family protein
MRYLFAILTLVGVTAGVRAHFVFVYVAEEAAEARLVFGHAAAPDPMTPATRAEKTTLTARDGSGKDTALQVEKGDGNFYRAELPAEKPVLVFGTTEAGVTQRGENPPMLSWYYPKVIVGDPFARTAQVGAEMPLEIVPVRDGDSVRFQVLAQGKPVGGVEVTASLSGGDEEAAQTVTTDAKGLTEGFSQPGRYCVAARTTDATAGEFGGKPYATVRHTATLVFDFGTPER